MPEVYSKTDSNPCKGASRKALEKYAAEWEKTL